MIDVFQNCHTATHDTLMVEYIKLKNGCATFGELSKRLKDIRAEAAFSAGKSAVFLDYVQTLEGFMQNDISGTEIPHRS